MIILIAVLIGVFLFGCAPADPLRTEETCASNHAYKGQTWVEETDYLSNGNYRSYIDFEASLKRVSFFDYSSATGTCQWNASLKVECHRIFQNNSGFDLEISGRKLILEGSQRLVYRESTLPLSCR